MSRQQAWPKEYSGRHTDNVAEATRSTTSFLTDDTKEKNTHCLRLKLHERTERVWGRTYIAVVAI
jgi:hypothetical protein